MIKKLAFTGLILSSCSYISYSDALPLIKTAIVGVEDIEITDEFIAQQEYSFAKFKMGRSGIAILTLAYINDDIFEWVSSTNEKIYTYNGKIIKTEGLINNINILNIDDLIESSFETGKQYSVLVNLTNPQALVEQKSQYTFTSNLITETVFIPSLNKNFENFYYINDSNGRIVRTIQSIHPRLPKIEIDFYYKY
jgi:hypothetical protein